MVEETILCAVNTLVAWGFALLFIRRKQPEICFDAFLCAVVHGLLYFLISGTAYNRHLAVVSLIWFLLTTVIVQFQAGYGNAVIAFGLAQSGYSALGFLSRNALRLWGRSGIFCCLAGIAAFLLAAYLVRDRLPEENWREYWTEEVLASEKLRVRLWQVYFTVLLGSGNLSAFLWWTDSQDWLDFFAAAAGIFALFWGEIWLLLLMQAYRKERVEVLLDRQYRDEMQSFLNVIRSQRHDYNFHVHTMAGLLRGGNAEACLRYMDSLERDSAIMNAVLPVKDPAISAMIHNFHFLAVREGIQLHIDIENDLSQIATNPYETNKIISNLLQNAIDETKDHEDKSYGIHLTILKRGEYIVIRVSNEVDPLRMNQAETERIYGQGYSTKQGHDGVGLGSIRQLAGRYHGTVYTRIEENIVHFVAKIPINFGKKQENV